MTGLPAYLGTVAGWVTALASLVSTGILALIARTWLASRAMAIREKADARAGYGDLIDRLEARAKEVEEKLRTAEAHCSSCDRLLANMNLHLSEAFSGIRLLMDELEAKDPGNKVTVRVGRALAAAFRDLEPLPFIYLPPEPGTNEPH